jgi:hypothetical protein
MKKYIVLLLLISALLHSCTIQRPISTVPAANNKEYCVEYLFEHDGCKVYRFDDRNRTVYFTNCTGNTTAFDTSSVINNQIRVKKQ